MARAGKKSLLKDVRGAIGQEIVVKQYDYGIVITRYPDMSKVKRSQLQKKYQKDFKGAVAYAQSIIRDPVKKAAYQKKLRKGQRVYNAAIKEYLKSSDD
jgi:hypothetical protein